MSDETDLKQMRFILGVLIVLNILDLITTGLFMFIQGTTKSESNILFTLLGGGTIALIFIFVYKLIFIIGGWLLRKNIVAVSGARSINLLFFVLLVIGIAVIINNSYQIVKDVSILVQQPAMKLALPTKNIHIISSAFLDSRSVLTPSYDVWTPAENVQHYFWFTLPGIIALGVWLFHNNKTSVKGKKTLFFRNGWSI